MRIARLLRITMITVAGLVGTIAGLAGLLWLAATEPWYDDDVIKQIMPPSGGLANQVVDETSRVAWIFPVGTQRDAAIARLRRNGFDCRARAAAAPAICSRKIPSMICATTYIITLGGDVIDYTKATSQTVCL